MIVAQVKPAQSLVMSLLGAEVSLTNKDDGPHAIGNSSTDVFPRGLLIDLERCQTPDSNQRSNVRRDSLKMALAVTCTRDQNPASHVDIGTATAPLPQAVQGHPGDDSGSPMAYWLVRAVRSGPWMPRQARRPCREAGYGYALESEQPSGRASQCTFFRS